MTTTSSISKDSALASLIAEFVMSTPLELVQEVVEMVGKWQSTPNNFEKTKLLATIHSSATRSILAKILDRWQSEQPALTPEGFVTAITASLELSKNVTRPGIELIWTGPQTEVALRRTDQALLELISGASKKLLVVSFAVYKAKPVLDAIESALRRNVKVTICLEGAEESKGKISLSGIKAFSNSVFRLASFYVWPVEKRPHAPDGKYGSMHAKIAVADGWRVFISSANLTDYAMDLNMEMGVLIEDRKIAHQIEEMFSELKMKSILVKAHADEKH